MAAGDKKPEFNPFGTVSGRPVHPSGLDRNPESFGDIGYGPAEREAAKPKAMRDALQAENDLARRRLAMLGRWDHANYLGTPQTHAHAARTRQGPLARLYEAGGLTLDQLAYSIEIAMVAEEIERDVDPGIVSYEPRIDDSRYGKIKASLVEGIMRVRREVAYTHWRGWIPQPKRAILDMIVGDPKPFSTVARQYGMRKDKARRMLVRSLDLWPQAMEKAEAEVDNATLAAAHAGIL